MSHLVSIRPKTYHLAYESIQILDMNLCLNQLLSGLLKMPSHSIDYPSQTLLLLTKTGDIIVWTDRTTGLAIAGTM